MKTIIFSGFLGAGKTTLIKKLITESFKGQKLVLIENEFGEIGVDSGFLKADRLNNLCDISFYRVELTNTSVIRTKGPKQNVPFFAFYVYNL